MEKLIVRHIKAVEKFEMDLRSHEFYWTVKEARSEFDDICKTSSVLVEKHRYMLREWRKKMNLLKTLRD